MQRIRDENRLEFGRKKRKSDDGDEMRIRNKRRQLREVPLVTGNIRFYAQSDDEKTQLFNKIDRAKLLLDDRVSNTSNSKILHEVFDFYLQQHALPPKNTTADNLETNQFTTYLPCPKEQSTEKMCIITESAMKNLCTGLQVHAHNCSKLLKIETFDLSGHTGKFTLQCDNQHSMQVDTSPRLPGGSFLSNFRILHALFVSGLRYAQYERFVTSAGLGLLPETFVSGFVDLYSSKTSDIAHRSIKGAIDEETATTKLHCSGNNSEFKGITIMTDARHGWRKNARHSDVVAIGFHSKKVIGLEVVTKDDDPVSQRHETVGVKKLYDHFDKCGINVDIHGHDRNVTINKYLSENRVGVTNANDTWHATKGISKEIKKVCTGPVKFHAVKWHGELSDKAASVKTHCYYAMKNCGGSAEKLRSLLDNIVMHYRNIHDSCLPESRCKTDENYEPSKIILRDPIAIKLLDCAIKRLAIYKSPEDYVNCVDTHYVESFNNACLVYHDKRISFSDKEYKRRSHLAILDWNENIGRDYTSLTFYEDPRCPRKITGKKNLKPKTRNFTRSIWESVMEHMYLTQHT